MVHKLWSIAQLNFIFAKFSAFILKKQDKFFPAIANTPEETTNPLPKLTPPHYYTFDTPKSSNHTFLQTSNTSSYVL